MLDNESILTRVGQELSLTIRYQEWMTALNYYLGNPMGTEMEGRSKVISTDVADAIEWIRPQIMKALFANNEVVRFDPTGPQDEMQAELETEFVYDVITKDNNGFIAIHDFVFDALLQKFGVMKCYYEENLTPEVSQFTGLTQEQLTVALSNPNAEIVQYEQAEDGSYSLKLALPAQGGRIVIESIPPEQFRYNSDHTSIDLKDARFTAHVVNKTLSDLAKDGYDPEVLEQVGQYIGINPTLFRMRAQGEQVWEGQNVTDDPSQRLIAISECYMQMDIDEDGIAEKVKVTVVGDTTPTHVLSIEEIDEYPWIATTAILMPHKFQGLSIYDRLRQIQEIKTALLRNTIDNISYQNNQRTIIVEGMANIDDVLISRPGGIIRAKSADAVQNLTTPQIGSNAFSMLQYLDEVRAGRVGVSPEGNATPQKIGANVGSMGVEQLMSAKEELVGLIIRVIAETGIKPLYTRVRELLVKHTDAIQNFKFRGQWVQTNPAAWPQRSRTTIRVGTGSGDNSRRMGVIQQILQIQSQIQQIPGQALVDPSKVYSALDDMAKYGELDGASRYFMDPNSPQGQQAAQAAAQQMQQQQQQQMQQQLQELQFQQKLADAEMGKAQAQQQNAVLRAQYEEQKLQLTHQIESLKAQLSNAKTLAEAAGKDADRELNKFKVVMDTAVKLTQLEASSGTDQDENFEMNNELIESELPGEDESHETEGPNEAESREYA